MRLASQSKFDYLECMSECRRMGSVLKCVKCCSTVFVGKIELSRSIECQVMMDHAIDFVTAWLYSN